MPGYSTTMISKSLILLYGICFISFSACKENNSPAAANPGSAFTPLNRSYTKTDTIRFTGDSNRFAVSGIMAPGAWQADSSRKVVVDLLYYVKGKQVNAITDTFDSRGDEELSHYFEGMDTAGNSCEHFLTICYGFPACGYTQSHITYFTDASRINKILSHQSYADGTWGSGVEFSGACGPKSTTELFSAMVSHGDDKDTGSIQTVSYSDSTQYTFDGNKWNAKLIGEKDRVYRTEKISF